MELCKWTIDLGALPSFQQNASVPNSNGIYTGASRLYHIFHLQACAAALGQKASAERQQAARLAPEAARSNVGDARTGVHAARRADVLPAAVFPSVSRPESALCVRAELLWRSACL